MIQLSILYLLSFSLSNYIQLNNNYKTTTGILKIKNQIKQPNYTLNKLDEKETTWEDCKIVSTVLHKYFKTTEDTTNKKVKMFSIHGVPSALAIIDDNKVQKFLLNKGLILVFDAGPIMRKTFYKNYKNLDLYDSEQLNTFLNI